MEEDIPDDGANHDGFLSAKDVGDEARGQGADPGTESHGGRDATLGRGLRTTAVAILISAGLVEVALVLFGAEDGGHGRNVETEEATSNDGDGRDEIDVTDSTHGDCLSLSQRRNREGEVEVEVEGERKRGARMRESGRSRFYIRDGVSMLLTSVLLVTFTACILTSKL